MTPNLVKDWMTPKVLAVSSAASLTAADATMDTKHVRRLLVVDDGKLVGMLTTGDLRSTLAEFKTGKPNANPTVADAMTPDPISVPESCNIGLAAQTMLAAKISGLPVVDEAGGLVGILSESDVFRYVIEVSQEV